MARVATIVKHDSDRVVKDFKEALGKKTHIHIIYGKSIFLLRYLLLLLSSNEIDHKFINY